MSTPNSGHDAPTLSGHTAPTVATPTPAPRQGGGGKMGRRLLFAAGGLALCGGCATLTPLAIKTAGQYTEDQLRAAFQNGVISARQTILNDLQQLEVGGEIISLDAALAAASLTKLAVKYVVGPMASVVATLGGGALDLLVNTISAIISGINLIPNSSGFVRPLQQLHDMLTTWRLNLALLPNTIDQYANWDVDSAQSYLTALKAKIEAEQQAASATGTPGAATPALPTPTATPALPTPTATAG